MDNPLARKLMIKPGTRILVRNAPPDFLDRLDPLPDGARVETAGTGIFDAVLHFVSSKTEVDEQASGSLESLRENGLLWMVYPKRSKSVEPDINRDTGWEALWNAGWVGISIIAIDETWAGLRFRPEKDVKRKPDSMFLKKQ